MFYFIKKGAGNFWHRYNNNTKEVNMSEWQIILELVGQTVSLQMPNGSNIPAQNIPILEVIVIDETDLSLEETFANVQDLRTRLIALGYNPYLTADGGTTYLEAGSNITITGAGTLVDPYVISATGGGGGAVSSVNTDTGAVIVDIQSVLSQTNKVYTETIGDYTYELSAFVDEGGKKLFRIGITNNETFVQSYIEIIEDKLRQYLQDGSELTIEELSTLTVGKEIMVGSGAGTNIFKIPFKTVSGSPVVSQRSDLPTGNYDLALDTKVISSNYTAVNGEPLSVTANATITDPTGVSGKGYTIYVPKSGVTATIGGVGYGVGSFVFRFYDGSGWVSKNFDFTSALALKEDLSNKVTDLTTNDNTHYPTTQAVQSAINTAVTGLLDYRGSYDASTNLFPATGGSGIAGAVLKGDFWICSVAGTLGGVPVTSGDLIIAIVDTPAQTSSNWDLISNELGYQAENTANKTDTVAGNTSSSTKYLSVKGYYDYLIGMTWLTDSIFGTFLNGLTAKTTPVNADVFTLSDSADSNKAKKITWSNIKATLATAFFLDATSSIQTQIDSKLPTAQTWTSYGGSSTIVGFSSTTINQINYIVIGKLMFLSFEISGTSNATNFTFTIPQTSASYNQGGDIIGLNNSGTYGFCVYSIDSSTSVVKLFFNTSNTTNNASWTASGTKFVKGSIILNIA
jgi:hypothetical protein